MVAEDEQKSSSEAPGGIPRTVFSLDHVPSKERFSVWKESISCLFDVECDRETRQEGFFARIDSGLFGEVMLAEASTVTQHCSRSKLGIARDGMDHYMIQLYLAGGMEAGHRGGATSVGKHDLIVFDLAQEFRSLTDGTRNLSLIVSREALGGVLKAPDDQHMRTLSPAEPLAALLGSHLLTLHRLAKEIPAAQAAEVGAATVALVAACLNGTPRNTPGGTEGVTFARLTMIKRMIEQNLSDPGLSAARIARMAGVSRSRLYTMFEPLGGVAGYVRERRLRRAFSALTDPRQYHRPIFEIAMDSGFLSESAFSRAFRRRFDRSPRDLRRHGALSKAEADAEHPLDRRYEHWVQHLSGY